MQFRWLEYTTKISTYRVFFYVLFFLAILWELIERDKEKTTATFPLVCNDTTWGVMGFTFSPLALQDYGMMFAVAHSNSRIRCECKCVCVCVRWQVQCKLVLGLIRLKSVTTTLCLPLSRLRVREKTGGRNSPWRKGRTGKLITVECYCTNIHTDTHTDKG